MVSREQVKKVVELLEKQKKLELATMAAAVQSIRDGLNWESNFIRGKGQQEADDVGHLILGDVNINEERTNRKNSLLPILAATVLSTLLGGGAGALAVKWLSQAPAPVKQAIQKAVEYEMDFADPKTSIKDDGK